MWHNAAHSKLQHFAAHTKLDTSTLRSWHASRAAPTCAPRFTACMCCMHGAAEVREAPVEGVCNEQLAYRALTCSSHDVPRAIKRTCRVPCQNLEELIQHLDLGDCARVRNPLGQLRVSEDLLHACAVPVLAGCTASHTLQLASQMARW
jgi:hypothetical protein